MLDARYEVDAFSAAASSLAGAVDDRDAAARRAGEPNSAAATAGAAPAATAGAAVAVVANANTRVAMIPRQTATVAIAQQALHIAREAALTRRDDG